MSITPDRISPLDVGMLPDERIEKLYGSLTKKLIPKKCASRLTAPVLALGENGAPSSSLSRPPGFSESRLSSRTSGDSSPTQLAPNDQCHRGSSTMLTLNFSGCSPISHRAPPSRPSEAIVLAHPLQDCTAMDDGVSKQTSLIDPHERTTVVRAPDPPVVDKGKSIMLEPPPVGTPGHPVCSLPVIPANSVVGFSPGPDDEEEEDPEMDVEFGQQLFGNISDNELVGLLEDIGFQVPGDVKILRSIVRRIRQLDGEEGEF